MLCLPALWSGCCILRSMLSLLRTCVEPDATSNAAGVSVHGTDCPFLELHLKYLSLSFCFTVKIALLSYLQSFITRSGESGEVLQSSYVPPVLHVKFLASLTRCYYPCLLNILMTLRIDLRIAYLPAGRHSTFRSCCCS